jgi:sialate O-acetylesterase
MNSNLLCFAFIIFAPVSLHARVKLNPLFSDGAVLQRGKPLPVWGTARSGELVTVELAGQKVSTTASDGKWSVNLQPLAAGGPLTMTIMGDEVVTVKDLLVGEVWLCSGQSNMHFRMASVENSNQEIADANEPNIRFFNVPQQMAQCPTTILQGVWKPVSPDSAGQCSAVAYYFGKELQRKLGVPVGLLISAVGGTRIESWMRSETLAATGESAALIEKWSDVSSEDFARIGKDYSAFQYQRDHVHPKAVREARAQGAALPTPPTAPKIRCHDCPSALHNGMIAPLLPFALRGAIWYQGESNSGQPSPYQKLLPAMIHDWRKIWGDDLPFLFVQLAPHRGIHPAFREAQHLIWNKTPRSAMAVTLDVGDAENIHPTKKKPVGQRLALAARALAYGEEIDYSGPIYQSMTVENECVVLSFKNAEGGLIAKDGPLTGFTVAGGNKKFVPAKAEIHGSTIRVFADGVKSPKAARYAWAHVPEANLFGKNGLPAPPFRTDVN